ncbi:MAG: hypothetical protein U9P42_02540 [Candidatus Fermentibacteria bacterium]|nr:hypothetical protein [Candidatus Fermentibacteria bacterium]
MKSQKNRLFWSALGCSLLHEKNDYNTEELPEEMLGALASPIKLPDKSRIVRGTDLEGKRGRYIYMHTWKILRDLGFSRPFRCEVLAGIELFVPFFKDRVVVLPQGFQKRIPLKLRAHALVGKNAALCAGGMQLIIVAAVYEKATWDILEHGGCTVCHPDKLSQLLQTLDLSL